jgi:glycosyltransferase involved in cell wall biosynthesis
VLASNVGGIPELVQDNINGFLHKYDEPASLTQNIRNIIANPGLLDSMKEACLNMARNYDLKKQVTLIADEYKRILDNK